MRVREIIRIIDTDVCSRPIRAAARRATHGTSSHIAEVIGNIATRSNRVG
jgi:hypothetical protein